MGSRNYSWPLIILFFGIMLLLNTTGVIGWDIWVYTLRFWPILVIIVGINIILGSSRLGRIIQSLLTLILLLFVFVVSYIQYSEKGITMLPSSFNEWVLQGGSGMFNLTDNLVREDFWISSNEYEEVNRREIKMNMSASEFLLEDSIDIDEYILVNSSYPKAFRPPVIERELEDDVLNIYIDGAGREKFNLFTNESEYEVKIGHPDIVTDFDINLGAGKGEVELSKIQIEDFVVEVGAGNLTTAFSINSLPKGEIRFIVGAGRVNLIIPQRISYSLEYDLGIGNIKINDKTVSGISGGKGSYESEDYRMSDTRINMLVTVGVGTFNIENR